MNLRMGLLALVAALALAVLGSTASACDRCAGSYYTPCYTPCYSPCDYPSYSYSCYPTCNSCYSPCYSTYYPAYSSSYYYGW